MQPPSTPLIPRLNIWDPSDQDLVLFECVWIFSFAIDFHALPRRTYSPLHAALWYLVQPGNWQIVLFVMVVTTLQLGALSKAYRQLVKDREILSSEVMYEYNTRVS
jgi:hypothetical protein